MAECQSKRYPPLYPRCHILAAKAQSSLKKLLLSSQLVSEETTLPGGWQAPPGKDARQGSSLWGRGAGASRAPGRRGPCLGPGGPRALRQLHPAPERVEGPARARAALTSLPATRQPNMAAAGEPPQTPRYSRASMNAVPGKSTRPRSPRHRRVTSAAPPIRTTTPAVQRAAAHRRCGWFGVEHHGRCSSSPSPL